MIIKGPITIIQNPVEPEKIIENNKLRRSILEAAGKSPLPFEGEIQTSGDVPEGFEDLVEKEEDFISEKNQEDDTMSDEKEEIKEEAKQADSAEVKEDAKEETKEAVKEDTMPEAAPEEKPAEPKAE